MQKRKNAGFTLVELVVVIAVLAILGGIGTLAYSGYVEYTQKAADKQTVSEILYAIELANYDDSTLFENGAVIFVGGPDSNGITSTPPVEAALSKALENLSAVNLTYGDWGLGSFSDSIKDGFKNNVIGKTDSKSNAYWEALEETGKAASFAADVDDLWEHFTSLKDTAYWDADNVGKAVKMSNTKQEDIIKAWTEGTTFFTSEITDGVQTDKAWYALSMARNYSFAAYAEKSGNLTDNMKKELDAFKLSCGVDKR